MDRTHQNSATSWLGWLAALLPWPCPRARHRAPAQPATQAATFRSFPHQRPPAALRHLLAACPSTHLPVQAGAGKAYRATLVHGGADPVEFMSAAPVLDYSAGDDGHADGGSNQRRLRQSRGCAGAGPWAGSRQQLSLHFSSDDAIGGGHSLYEGSCPGMAYSLFFDDLPGMPGYSGFASYPAREGEMVIDWDRDNDSSSGAYAFTVLVEATPAHWGIGPDHAYLLEVLGDFID